MFSKLDMSSILHNVKCVTMITFIMESLGVSYTWASPPGFYPHYLHGAVQKGMRLGIRGRGCEF